jgi:hypothetical protein
VLLLILNVLSMIMWTIEGKKGLNIQKRKNH